MTQLKQTKPNKFLLGLNSLQSRIVAISLILVTSLTLAGVSIYTYKLNNSLMNSMHTEMVTLCQSSSRSICIALENNDLGAISEVAAWLKTSQELDRIIFKDENGFTMVSFPEESAPEQSSSQATLSDDEIEYLTVTEPVYVDDILFGYLSITRSLEPIYSQQRNSWLTAVIIGGIAMLLGILMSISLSRAIIKPLKKMKEAAAQVAVGDYTGRLEYSGNDEVSELVEEFNFMVEKVSQRAARKNEELRRVNESLITEMERKEIETQETLYELARLPEENPGPIVRVTREGVLTYSNRASTQLLNSWNCKINESIPDNLIKVVKYALDKQEVTEITVQVEGRTYLLVVSPFTSSGYVNIYGKDISKLKQIEENERKLQIELINAERIKSLGLLAGGVAHDLNNMLGPLVGYPELILRKLPDDSPFRDQIKKIGSSARDAASVIQDLLTLARRGRYEMVVTDLNEVITEYLDSPGFEQIKEENPEINFVIDLENEKQLIKGSSPHLAKVVMNLVVNAVDALGGEGTLTISTKTQTLNKLFSGYSSINAGEYVVFKVQDTGYGIESEDIKKIFEPYYSKKTMQGSRGSGLGLSVVYGILQDHGGYYDVFSEVGKGTEFVLYFPLTTESQEFKDISEVLPEGSEAILVVDDDDGQRDLIQQVLSTFGYEVTTAKNGTEAVRIIESQSFDLVVLDMIMEPGFDGLDTYKRIIEISPGQKAIIVSGFSASRRLEEALKLGVGQLVKKPFELKHLATAVRSELDKQETGALA